MATSEAKFKCLNCENKFNDKPGPHVSCPKCGAAYVKWLNFEEMRKNGYK